MSEPVAEKEAGPAPDNNNGTESEPPKEKRKREYKDFGHDEEKPTRMCSMFNFCFPVNFLHPIITPFQLLTLI